jgi:hypothetical protein
VSGSTYICACAVGGWHGTNCEEPDTTPPDLECFIEQVNVPSTMTVELDRLIIALVDADQAITVSLDDITMAVVNVSESWGGTVLSLPAGLPVLEQQSLQIIVADSAGNSATCDALIYIDAPRLQLSVTTLAVSTLLTSTDVAQLSITNAGTENLVLRTGAPHGMAILGPDLSTVAWAVATTTDVVLAGAMDVQTLLYSLRTTSRYRSSFWGQLWAKRAHIPRISGLEAIMTLALLTKVFLWSSP